AQAMPVGRWRRALTAAALVVVIIAPLWRQNFEPRQAAKLLFSANAAMAYRTGMDPSMLMTLDEARCTATLNGQRGVCTVWRYGGHQLQIRENGIPLGVVSTDPGAFPRFLPETLQMVLPLVLHEKPERLLLLGLGSSESLSAALSFPLPDV